MCTKKKAAVFIILGQSNAVGHGIPMREEDMIKTPLKNVFGLSREENQSFQNTRLRWSGYTSHGMNLAETQDHTYSVPNCLASLWQKHIDAGNAWNLPDLYIIQIAIGAQGVTRKYMWYPDREEKLIPGPLGTVDISLFPFASHIFSLLEKSFAERDCDYEIIGLHWRGGEEDVSLSTKCLLAHLKGIYQRIFDDFNVLLKTPPIVLHKIVCHDCMMQADPTGERLKSMHYINDVFYGLEKAYENVSVFDPCNAPYFIPNVIGNGIFEADAVHFTPAVNTWVAESVIEKYKNTQGVEKS